MEALNHNQQIGKLGEELAREFLESKGYEILDLNCKKSYKEIDLVAFKDNKFIFVEVKTRTSNKFGGAIDAINTRKLHHLKKGIMMYLSDLKKPMADFRLDLIAIDLDIKANQAEINHITDIV